VGGGEKFQSVKHDVFSVIIFAAVDLYCRANKYTEEQRRCLESMHIPASYVHTAHMDR
jgi:hypothetical protein